MTPKKKKQKPLDGHIINLSSSDRIIVKFRTKKGAVVKFSVTYLRKIKGVWLEIRRCDNAHDGMVVHSHMFKYNDNNVTITPLRGDLDYLLTKSIEDFKKHYLKYLDYYLK